MSVRYYCDREGCKREAPRPSSGSAIRVDSWSYDHLCAMCRADLTEAVKAWQEGLRDDDLKTTAMRLVPADDVPDFEERLARDRAARSQKV